MPKTIADRRIALVLLDGPPADPKAITVDEFDAGIRLECRILDYRLSPTASDTVQQSELCKGSNASVPTRKNAEGNITPFRYLTAAGLADATNDVAFDALREGGTLLHLVEREGPEHADAGAAGQEYSYWEVLTDDPAVPSDRGGYIRREITLLPQEWELNKELVSA